MSASVLIRKSHQEQSLKSVRQLQCPISVEIIGVRLRNFTFIKGKR